jgi:hypothetical protein
VATAQGIGYGPVWTAAGIIVAFFGLAFTLRIKREADIRSRTIGKETVYWLPPAEFVMLASLVVVLIGVFVLPVLGAGLEFARYALGWGFLLLAGYPLALAGHYEILFGRVSKDRQEEIAEKGYDYDTAQEMGVIYGLAVASVVYLAAVVIRETT